MDRSQGHTQPIGTHKGTPGCVSRSEELRQCQAATVEQMERYEAKHLGGFKRIYPREGGEKYDKYFKHSSSLFQETAASKAREECARYRSTSTKSRRLNQLHIISQLNSYFQFCQFIWNVV